MHNFIFKKVSSKEEMEESYAIRTKVFCEEQKISKEIEFDNLDHLCSHFLIFDDKKVIATARVRQKEENILKIERVAVLFEFRRLKVGSTLIKNIIQYFINLNENISFILHSQVAVADFYESINFIESWIVSFGFTFQLYFDFSGYIDMATGSALLFNILLPKNFDSPFKATNLINFWKCWHITLFNFLMNYIYFPILRSFFSFFSTFLVLSNFSFLSVLSLNILNLLPSHPVLF